MPSQDAAPWGTAHTTPTLVAGRRYVSAVVAVPGEVGEKVTRWRESHGLMHLIPPHITVFITELGADVSSPEGAAGQLRRACAGFGVVDLVLGEVGTFLPLTPVVFMDIVAGAGRLGELHRACGASLVDASPFPYRPHLTLAQGPAAVGLVDALAEFEGYRYAFPADRLELYHGGLAGWEPCGIVTLR